MNEEFYFDVLVRRALCFVFSGFGNSQVEMAPRHALSTNSHGEVPSTTGSNILLFCAKSTAAPMHV